MERPGPWRRLAAIGGSGAPRLWVMFAFVALIAPTNNTYLPDSLRLTLSDVRPYAIVAVLGLVIASALRDRLAVRDYIRRSSYGGLAVIGAMFPVFYLLVSGLKGELRIATAMLYALWALGCFVAWPLLARTRDEMVRWIHLLLAAGLLGWLIPVAYGSVVGEPADRVFTDIRSFGYVNPDYFAQLIQVVFACAMVVTWRRRPLALARIALLVAAPVAIYALSARNVLVFVVVLVVARPLIRAARRPGLAVGAILSLSVLLALTVSQYFERGQVNRFSSGRLDSWSERVDQAFATGDDAVTFFIGPESLPVKRRSGYDALTEAKRFSKFHTDNAYLELFFEAGALGVLLFMWPYLLAGVGGLRRVRRSGDELAIWGVAVLLAIACQSMFMSSIPTFFNPVAFLFLTGFCAALGPVRAPR